MAIKVFRFKQETPSANWIVYHALAKQVSFDAIIDLDGTKQKAYPSTIVHTSPNSMTLTWSEPRSGSVTVTAIA